MSCSDTLHCILQPGKVTGGDQMWSSHVRQWPQLWVAHVHHSTCPLQGEVLSTCTQQSGFMTVALCQHFTATQKLTQLERQPAGGVPYQQVECQLLTQYMYRWKAAISAKSLRYQEIQPFLPPTQSFTLLSIAWECQVQGLGGHIKSHTDSTGLGKIVKLLHTHQRSRDKGRRGMDWHPGSGLDQQHLKITSSDWVWWVL